MTVVMVLLLGWITLGIIGAALQALIDTARHKHVASFIARIDDDADDYR